MQGENAHSLTRSACISGASCKGVPLVRVLGARMVEAAFGNTDAMQLHFSLGRRNATKSSDLGELSAYLTQVCCGGVFRSQAERCNCHEAAWCFGCMQVAQ